MNSEIGVPVNTDQHRRHMYVDEDEALNGFGRVLLSGLPALAHSFCIFS